MTGPTVSCINVLYTQLLVVFSSWREWINLPFCSRQLSWNGPTLWWVNLEHEEYWPSKWESLDTKDCLNTEGNRACWANWKSTTTREKQETKPDANDGIIWGTETTFLSRFVAHGITETKDISDLSEQFEYEKRDATKTTNEKGYGRLYNRHHGVNKKEATAWLDREWVV